MISAVIHARNKTAAAKNIDLMPDSPAVATWLTGVLFNSSIAPESSTRDQTAIEEGDDDVGVRQYLHRGYRPIGVGDPDPESPEPR